jgi:hypothetical protein
MYTPKSPKIYEAKTELKREITNSKNKAGIF